jgi:hypothetical protein
LASPTAAAGKEERPNQLYLDVNDSASGSTVKREARQSCLLAESWRGAAVVECDTGDGTVALLPLLALAKMRRREKRGVQNCKGGARLGLKAGACAGATGRHPVEGFADVCVGL